METPWLRLAFGALRRFSAALWPCDLARSPSALERRRIAHPEGLGLRRFSKSITAGICGQRNGVQGSVRTAATLSRSCPLWVINGHQGHAHPCPLYPQSGHRNLAAILARHLLSVV